MSHTIHEGPHRVFADNCEECIERTNLGLNGLTQLDHENLLRLAILARDKREYFREEGHNPTNPRELGASYADMRAVETLRLAARIVFASGINLDDAR